MKILQATRETTPSKVKLRNFDLSVEEIRIMRAIKEMTDAFERISENTPDPARLDFYGYEIKKNSKNSSTTSAKTL